MRHSCSADLPVTGCGTFDSVVLALGDGLELDTLLFELRRHGQQVPLEPQAFDVLVYLVSHRDRVVPKDELMDAIWGGRFVTETAVTSRIKQVRKALGDDGQAQRSIRTLHGRGYHFVGPVEVTVVADPRAGVGDLDVDATIVAGAVGPPGALVLCLGAGTISGAAHQLAALVRDGAGA